MSRALSESVLEKPRRTFTSFGNAAGQGVESQGQRKPCGIIKEKKGKKRVGIDLVV